MNQLEQKLIEVQLGVLKVQHALLESQLKSGIKFNPNRDQLGRFASGGSGGPSLAPDTGSGGGGGSAADVRAYSESAMKASGMTDAANKASGRTKNWEAREHSSQAWKASVRKDHNGAADAHNKAEASHEKAGEKPAASAHRSAAMQQRHAASMKKRVG
jgi:hypothetical protein